MREHHSYILKLRLESTKKGIYRCECCDLKSPCAKAGGFGGFNPYESGFSREMRRGIVLAEMHFKISRVYEKT